MADVLRREAGGVTTIILVCSTVAAAAAAAGTLAVADAGAAAGGGVGGGARRQPRQAEVRTPPGGAHTIQRKVLNQLGATIELAGDGAKAVDIFKDAIERMPEMDGYEATMRIRKEESRYGICTPIIALTSHSMEDDLQKAIHAGMNLHMTNPIERRTIVEAVHGVCKRQ
uniref:Response regulatory domain-containing protein n=1 Tax=Oryza rufipogon TaxID=4529 RepID=A0A0E0PIW9_ORYRU